MMPPFYLQRGRGFLLRQVLGGWLILFGSIALFALVALAAHAAGASEILTIGLAFGVSLVNMFAWHFQLYRYERLLTTGEQMRRETAAGLQDFERMVAKVQELRINVAADPERFIREAQITDKDVDSILQEIDDVLADALQLQSSTRALMDHTDEILVQGQHWYAWFRHLRRVRLLSQQQQATERLRGALATLVVVATTLKR